MLDKVMADHPGRNVEPADYMDFTEEALAKYIGLRKHKGLVLI